MIPSKRLILLFILGVIPLSLSGMFPVFLWLGLIYNVGLLVLGLVDFIITPKPKSLILSRQHEEKLSLGQENIIFIRIKNRSRSSLKISIKDEYPYQFKIDKEVLTLEVPPSEEKKVHYTLVPTSRGDYEFGAIFYRYPGVLGLIIRQSKLKTKDSIKIYPDLLKVVRYEFLLRRNHLLHSGFKVSRLKGKGLEFESLRNYLPDDDYRFINWKVTARKREPITQEYRAERRQDILILIDCGRMMVSKVNSLSKLDHSINAALMLGGVGIREGDRVGLLAFSKDIFEYLPPKEGKGQLKKIVEALYNIKPELTEPDYKKAFRLLYLRNRKRSLLIIFTDLTDIQVSSLLLSYLSVLASQHLLLIITIEDPQLRRVSEILPSIPEEAHQKAQACEILIRRQEALNRLKKAGVLVLETRTEDLSVALVNKYLEIKGRNLL